MRSNRNAGTLTIHVLLACHNRKTKTLTCLKSLRRQKGLPKGVKIRVVLFDDGSTDGTAKAVRAGKLADKIVQGDGNYFWSRAMRALVLGLKAKDRDQILLLNDDTVLEPNAAALLLRTWKWSVEQDPQGGIVVGAFRGINSDETTYSGLVRVNFWHPLKVRSLDPGSEPLMCETLHANCVMVPKTIMDKVGGLSAAYTHSGADYDLGFRARRMGIPVWLAPGYVGRCDFNPPMKKAATFKDRWKDLSHPKKFPAREMLRFSREFGGFRGQIIWFGAIIKRLLP